VVKTLLVDGDNLFKIGFHGVRDYYHDGNHIGGIYHFINVLKKFLEEHNYDKVIVFWDGNNNATQRRALYPQYKQNRRETMNEIKKQSFYHQKSRVRLYLEEMFIRQVILDGCESDDSISYYCSISPDENKTIFSSDKDLTQLISDKVQIYSPLKRQYIKNGDRIKFDSIEIIPENVVTLKTLIGDKSDNIDGVLRLGEKTVLKFFPEIVDTPVSVDDILTRAKVLIEEDSKNKTLRNLIDGVTKNGVFGKEILDTNKKIVDLSNPLISEDGKEEIDLYYREELDPEGRGYKNLIKYMMEDGLFKYLPKKDNAWVEFLQPFMKLTRKEKRRFNNKK
jgi:5'-3' exonuclease